MDKLNLDVFLKGKVVELDPNQKYNIRVELEDGSPVWVNRDMLVVDDGGTNDLESALESSSEPRKLIYFNDMQKYLRYDRVMKKHELIETFNFESDMYQYWFTQKEVGNILWLDFGLSVPIQYDKGGQR